MVSKKILIIDGSITYCKTLQMAINGHGLQADYTHSVLSALDRLLGNKYSLLVVDVCLPGVKDGLEFIRLIRQSVEIPILVLSEGLSTDEKKSAFRAGADVYMEKPVDTDLCVAQIQSLLSHYERAKVYLQ